MAENKQYDRVKEITDQLEAGIENLFHSDQYRQWLTTMSRFHDYSLNNTLLIAMQKPDATLVAGYTTWKNQFGRQVNRGEKGIRILAPTPYKQKVEVDKTDPITGEILMNPDGSHQKEIKEVLRPAFKVVSVFDVSQTEGKELPSLEVNELTGDVEQYEMFFEALRRTCPVPMEFEKISSGAKGYYHQIEKRITILEGMSQIQTVKTAIHEMAHQKMHTIDPERKVSDQSLEPVSRGEKEVEAESVAYTVCQHYGIDTSDYSFDYIAGWSQGKETPELKASLNTIRKAASEMIHDIDENIKQLNLEQEKEVSVKKEAAYSIGNYFLEVHEASDGSWDFTLYGGNYRELDGGQIGNSETMTIAEATKEIAAYYQLEDQTVELRDRGRLEEMVSLYNPELDDEQMHFIEEVIEQGFDPKEFWVAGKPVDLTARMLSAGEIADIQYQVKIDNIPRMLFTAGQWHEIEFGIADKVDVTVYADPAFTPEQMSLLHGALNAEYYGYLNREDVLSVAIPVKSAEQIRRELYMLRRDLVSGKRANQKESEKKSVENVSRKNGKRKSLLADLQEKKAVVNGNNSKSQGRSRSKEME